MKIWVDADACPVVIKEILYKAARRTETHLILVANQFMQTPNSPLIKSIKVGAGFDVADDEIVRRIESGDILITADIPLAAEAIEKGAKVLTPRGEVYNAANIRQRLNMRDFMDTLRSTGVDTGGPPPFSQKERKAFADKLDQVLTQNRQQ